MITKNQVYTKIANAVEAMNIGCGTSSTPISTVTKLPHACIYEESTSQKHKAFGSMPLARVSTFRVEVYTEMENGGYVMGDSITDTITTTFNKCGYMLASNNRVPNYDAGIARIVSRFTRLIGNGDTMEDDEDEM